MIAFINRIRTISEVEFGKRNPTINGMKNIISSINAFYYIPSMFLYCFILMTLFRKRTRGFSWLVDTDLTISENDVESEVKYH